MSPKDGGQAFPVPAGNFSGGEAWSPDYGMTLRDYFAAHAPRDAQSWFEPTMPPRPERQYDHDHPNESQCERPYDCVPMNIADVDAYHEEWRRQYELQWPYAYADAMIAQRAR